MAIRVSCPLCGAEATAPDDFAGRKARLKKCKAAFIAEPKWKRLPCWSPIRSSPTNGGTGPDRLRSQRQSAKADRTRLRPSRRGGTRLPIDG
jgi:hypothetical protein